jgi:hypothetical protein
MGLSSTDDVLDVEGIRCTTTGIELSEELSLSRWARALGQLVLVERGASWAIGDLLAYGEEVGFGYDAAEEATGLSRGHLRNLAWVSRNVRPATRRSDLAWRAHKVVAHLEDDAQQREWLTRAADEQWTSDELKRELRRDNEAQDDSNDDQFPNPEGVCRCPRCGHEAPTAEFSQ